MKFPAFEYRTPTTIAEAVALLASGGGAAKAIAGGQSLLPTMAFRLAHPSMLVDLRQLDELKDISIAADGVRLGARTRWREIEDDRRLLAAQPLLYEALKHVAHYPIRNRGTIGGSLAHADPAAELPGIAVTCDAEIHVIGARGSRVIPAGQFFTGALSTVLADDELIRTLHLPPWPVTRRWGFEELAQRRGDFALAGVAVYYDLDAAGHATNAHLGVIGACMRPHRVTAAEQALEGRTVDEATINAVAHALEAALDPPSDLHASADYRRSLAGVLAERALHASARRSA